MFYRQAPIQICPSQMCSQIHRFIAIAVKTDPLLLGKDEKDKQEIEKLTDKTEALAKDLPSLNKKLTPLTYLYSNYPSTADISLYAQLHPSLVDAPITQHSTLPALLRYFLHIQSLPSVSAARKELPNAYPTLEIDIFTLPAPEKKAPAPKEKKDKATSTTIASTLVESASAAVSSVTSMAAGTLEAAKEVVLGESQGKQEKKKKEPKAVKPSTTATKPSPGMIDLRVGKVLEVKRHPNAELLYIESIDVGEPEPRTICSGLVGHMTEDDIHGTTVIVVCNMKPMSMRGVTSYGMLLCASVKEGKESGKVQFVLPPEGSQSGERVYFEGEEYENATPIPQLNPKKKIFETIQPHFTTLEDRTAVWIDPETKSVHRIRTKDGFLKSASFVGASLS
ncbi:methionine-tRNA ligase, beta subunit [Cryptococcus depauperatus]